MENIFSSFELKFFAYFQNYQMAHLYIFQIILENAELYVKDAEKFLDDGHDEVAIGDQRVDAVAIVERMSKRMRDGVQPDQLSMSSIGASTR